MAAFAQLITVVVISLTAFSSIDRILCSGVVKGSVLCTDCSSDYDFSGIRVVVKCDRVKKLSEAITDIKGDFVTTLPSSVAPTTLQASAASPKCLAKLLGGLTQLYARKQDMMSEVVVLARGDNNNTTTYSLLAPLVFSKSCHRKCGPHHGSPNNTGSSKTIDLPIPPEWGLPPTSDFFSFFPIIGIP